MAELDDKRNEVLRQNIDYLAECDIDHICTRKELGRFELKQFLPQVRDVRDIAKCYSQIDTTGLIAPVENRVFGLFDEVARAVKGLEEFTPGNCTDPPNDHRTLVNRTADQLRKPVDDLVQYFPVTVSFSTQQFELQATLSEFRLRLDECNRVKQEIDLIKSAAQDAAAETGASKYAGNFANTSKSHQFAAWMWMIITVLMGLLAAWLSYYLAKQENLVKLFGQTNGSHEEFIHVLSSRLIILSIMYLGVLWSVRNYRAHRHLAIVSKHRADALSTFQSFVEGTDDPVTKNQVLLETTRCIFAPSVTGYLGPDENTVGPVSEVMKSVIGGKP